MAWQSFGSLAAGNQNLSLFDLLTSQIAPCTLIPCTAAGANAITLAGTTNAPALGSYSDLVAFSFIAAANSTASITAAFGGLASLNVYYSDGVTQCGSGTIIGGQPYTLTWSQALNGGAGGFYLGRPSVTAPQSSALTKGYNAALNLQVNATAGSGILTVSIKDASTGNDPTTANPVQLTFRDTSSTGATAQVNVTSALSVTTQAVGATLGVQNSTPFSLWLVAFNNGGTAVLALWHSGAAAASPFIGPALNNQGALQSATGFSAGAILPNTFYCPNGTTITSKAFRILAVLDFAANATLSAAGFVAPTNIQLFGPDIKKPGEPIQIATGLFTGTEGTTNNTYTATTGVRISITPAKASSLILAEFNGVLNNNTDGTQSRARWSRGTTNNTNMFGNDTQISPGVTAGWETVACVGYDLPNTTSSQTYCIQIMALTNTANIGNNLTNQMRLTEIAA
jgi:hypothetical protein